MILADMHTHTNFSTDSQADPEAMLQSAYERGLTTYCFTDHMDYLFPMDNSLFVFDPEVYWKTMSELRERWRGRIDVKIGVELGLRDEADTAAPVKAFYEELLARYPFDFVIGSTHCLEHTDPYYLDYWEDKSGTQGMLRYLESELWNMEHYDGFHVCGHLDYLMRYVPKGKRVHELPLWPFLDEILHVLVKRGIGLEINTGALRRGYPRTNPAEVIVVRYHDIGGDLITIGSDAHYAEHVAADFDRAEAMLCKIGYKEYATFSGGKPEFHKF